MDTREVILPQGGGDGLLGGGGGIGALLIGALLFGGGLGGLGMGNRGYGSPAAGAVATDIVLNPAFQSLQTQIQTLGGQVSANDLRNEMESVENTFATISSGQTSANAANFAALGNQIGNLQTAVATNNFTTLDSINGLGRDVTAQANQNALQQLNSFNILNTSTQEMVKEALDKTGIIIDKVYLIGSIRIPASVKQALDDKVTATQLAQKAENEVKMAEANAKIAVAQAQGRSESVLVEAEAQAKANDLLAKSISPALISYRTIEKWNGVLPTVSGSNTPFITLPSSK